jgi:DNA-binding Lrp family transcriptional regulator
LVIVARKDLTYEQLQKQNRILARQLGQLKKEVKVDVKQLRRDSIVEGYESAVNQLQPQIDQADGLQNEIERLQKLLQDYGILY